MSQAITSVLQLLAAARVARERDKQRILFAQNDEPNAPAKRYEHLAGAIAFVTLYPSLTLP